jgi:hypothetical protein
MNSLSLGADHVVHCSGHDQLRLTLPVHHRGRVLTAAVLRPLVLAGYPHAASHAFRPASVATLHLMTVSGLIWSNLTFMSVVWLPPLTRKV